MVTEGTGRDPGPGFVSTVLDWSPSWDRSGAVEKRQAVKEPSPQSGLNRLLLPDCRDVVQSDVTHTRPTPDRGHETSECTVPNVTT